MCTVSYLPLNQGFCFTSNRDEGKMRPAAELPQHHRVGEQSVVFARDPEGGGTWFGVGEAFTLCLLNGGFGRHVRRPPYRKSRGLVVLDCFAYPHLGAFAAGYDLEGIEPFTLIAVSHQPVTVAQLKWDGRQAYLTAFNGQQPLIWHSPTLYTEPIAELRAQEWLQAVEEIEYQPFPHIRDFHLAHRYEDEVRLPADFRTDQVRTVSMISLGLWSQRKHLRYYDTQAEAITAELKW